ncbi:MAG: hypothetical protein AAGD08_15975 [Pseudomonadota bacterium]
MSTFLEICQRAAGESGAFNTGYTLPTTVVNQTGHEGQLVQWVKDAWRDIQVHRSRWEWMRDEFSANLVSSTQRYSGADLGLTRHAAWIVCPDSANDSGVTIYGQAEGVSDERQLSWMTWNEFRRRLLRGAASTTTGYPAYFTIDPARRLVLYPIPDRVFVVQGEYVKTPQVLALDADVPEMPERFHDLIWMKALLRSASDEEALSQYPIWRNDYKVLLNELERDELPEVSVAGWDTHSVGFGSRFD